MADLRFLDDVTTEASLLDINFKTMEEEIETLFNSYFDQGKKSTTKLLLDKPSLPVKETRTQTEIIQHIIFNSYNFIRGKFTSLYGEVGTDATLNEILEEFIRERMRVLILNHLFQHQDLGSISIGYIIDQFEVQDVSTPEAIADGYIEFQLRSDRVTQELRQIKDFARDFGEQVTSISEVVVNRLWGSPLDAYIYLENSLYSHFLGDHSEDENKETIRGILLRRYPNVTDDVTLVQYYATEIFVLNIISILKKTVKESDPDLIYRNIYHFIRKCFRGTQQEINPVAIKEIMADKYPDIEDEELIVQNFASDIFFRLVEMEA